MKYLLYIFCALVLACNDSRDCCNIINKTISDGKFILVGAFENSNSNTDGNKPDGGLVGGFGDVNIEVSQEEYNAYEIGDEYCFD